jgi:RNA polymerase sigma-70 factor (ECF subfamily)
LVPPGRKLELEVVEQLRPGLQIMALRALGDLEAAEEAVQETLVRALEALRDDRPRDPKKLGAFVRGIARHVIADAHQARRRTAPLAAVPETELGTGSDDPLSALITDEERGQVRRALARLSAADRDILHLSFFEGLTPVEIAERLGEPALRIRKRKSRALRRLREAFSRASATGHDSRSSGTDS